MNPFHSAYMCYLIYAFFFSIFIVNFELWTALSRFREAEEVHHFSQTFSFRQALCGGISRNPFLFVQDVKHYYNSFVSFQRYRLFPSVPSLPLCPCRVSTQLHVYFYTFSNVWLSAHTGCRSVDSEWTFQLIIPFFISIEIQNRFQK